MPTLEGQSLLQASSEQTLRELQASLSFFLYFLLGVEPFHLFRINLLLAFIEYNTAHLDAEVHELASISTNGTGVMNSAWESNDPEYVLQRDGKQSPISLSSGLKTPLSDRSWSEVTLISKRALSIHWFARSIGSR